LRKGNGDGAARRSECAIVDKILTGLGGIEDDRAAVAKRQRYDAPLAGLAAIGITYKRIRAGGQGDLGKAGRGSPQ